MSVNGFIFLKFESHSVAVKQRPLEKQMAPECLMWWILLIVTSLWFGFQLILNGKKSFNSVWRETSRMRPRPFSTWVITHFIPVIPMSSGRLPTSGWVDHFPVGSKGSDHMMRPSLPNKWELSEDADSIIKEIISINTETQQTFKPNGDDLDQYNPFATLYKTAHQA